MPDNKYGKAKIEQGFTLVEMLITIVIMGLAVIVISSLYYHMKEIQLESTHLDLATRAAQTEIEILRNNSYNSLTPGDNIDFTSSLPTGLPHDKKGTVVVSQPTADLRRVDVTVSYTDGSTPQNVELSSTIGVIGIGK